MPVYAYGCRECETTFDRLRRMDQDDTGVCCPRCGSDHIQRRLAVFAAHTRDGTGATATVTGGSGGCCRSGGCGCVTRN